jgi:hypothetical protein
MNVICGIYGYQITKPINLLGLLIEPRITDYKTAKTWARDQSCYHLTDVLKGEDIPNDLLFNLARSIENHASLPKWNYTISPRENVN